MHQLTLYLNLFLLVCILHCLLSHLACLPIQIRYKTATYDTMNLPALTDGIDTALSLLGVTQHTFSRCHKDCQAVSSPSTEEDCVNTFPAIWFILRIDTLPQRSFALTHCHLKVFYWLKADEYTLFNCLFYLVSFSAKISLF